VTGSDVFLLVVIIVLLLAMAYLAIAETGINRISRVKAEALAHDGTARSRALQRLVQEPEKFLNPVLLTINFVQVGQAFLTTILLDSLFGSWGLIIGFVLSVFILFVFTEAIPKTWAVLHSERAALMTARPILWLVWFPPLRFVTSALIGMANWLLPGKGLKQGPFVSEREFLGYVEAAAEDEVIEHEERRLIESIIEFGDTVAREIMVPRPDMVTVHASAKITEALDLAIEHGFSRFPVVGDSVDDVLGVAYAKDMMRAEREGRGFQPVGGLARPARFVPETKPVADLMREMQAAKFHMALLVDEYGGTAGLVTLEDCLEELVGEIIDEYDVEDDDIEHLPSGAVNVDGGLPIDELNELLDLTVPDEDWDTVAGFVFGSLGHVPHEGEAFEYEGHVFTAAKVDGRRISMVTIAPALEATAPDGSGSVEGADT
jgi:CBS domain containing-hemolysin-like protein